MTINELMNKGDDMAKCMFCGKRYKPKKNNHPTLKPINLMTYLCRLVTPQGGIVLDPFMGSGSTCVGCKNTNRKYIGIELDTNYFNTAVERLKGTI